MSEYQYYEFQTVDRRLSDREMQQLRSYSTRAVITPTSFSNEYSYGNFKGDPDDWMEKYFDGFVYVSNWGCYELQLALPAAVLSLETALVYCNGEAASAREKSGRVILRFCLQDETSVEWIEGEGILSSLLPLRAELAEGDLRSLYIGWLLNLQARELEEQELEPPVPPNLGEISGPLKSLLDFLHVDQDLLTVASEASPRRKSRPAQRQEIIAWVAQLPAAEKDQLLARLLAGEDRMLDAELRARFNRNRSGNAVASEEPRRTAGQLIAAAGIE